MNNRSDQVSSAAILRERAAVILTCLLASGCAVGPNFTPARPPTLDRYPDQSVPARLGADGSTQTIELGPRHRSGLVAAVRLRRRWTISWRRGSSRARPSPRRVRRWSRAGIRPAPARACSFRASTPSPAPSVNGPIRSRLGQRGAGLDLQPLHPDRRGQLRARPVRRGAPAGRGAERPGRLSAPRGRRGLSAAHRQYRRCGDRPRGLRR